MNRLDRVQSKFYELIQKFTGAGSTGSIFRNMGILASGSILAKFISIITYPIITRIYSPSDFGVLSVFTSAIAILLPFATFRYSVTIPLPKNDGLALNILLLGSGIILILSFFLSLIFIFVGEPVFSFFNMVEIANYWWLLILGIMGSGYYELLSHWATRKKSFKPVAKTTIWQTLLSSITQIVSGIIGLKPLGLLFGEVARSSGGVTSLYRYFRQDLENNWKYRSKNKITFLIKYYKGLPLYRLPSQILLQISTTMPVLYFAFKFGADSTGQLGLAKSMIGIPVSLLAGNVSKAYYAEIAQLGTNNGEKIKALTKSILKKLVTLSIIPILILIFFAPGLFKIFFGPEWEVAGRYTSILSLYTILVFLTMPLMSLFNIYNKQRKYLEINIIRMIFLLIIFGSSYYLELDEINTLYIYTFIYSFHFVFAGYQAYKLIKSI